MSALCFFAKKQSKGYGVRDDEEKEGFVLRIGNALFALRAACGGL